MSTKENDGTNTGKSEESIDQKVDDLNVPEDDFDLDMLINMGTGVGLERHKQAARRAAFDKALKRGKPKSD